MKQGHLARLTLCALRGTPPRIHHALALCLLIGCDKTERDWSKCNGEAAPCASGYMCTPEFRCVLQPDAGDADASADAIVASIPDSTTAPTDASEDTAAATAGDVAVDAATDVTVDTAVDVAADVAVDVAPSPCKVNGDCQGGRPVCVGGVCVECGDAGDCKEPARGFCVGNACVGCEQAGATACSGTTPVCAPAGTADAGGQCVQCLTSAGCAAATPICTNNTCTACTTASQCAGRSSTTSACAVSGANTGLCVQCAANTDCGGSTPVCDTTTNKCVQCLSSAGCAAATPICTNNICTACTTAAQCAAKSATTPACASSGSSAGQCVACTDSSTCSGTTAVCDTTTNKCVACTDNSTCSGTTPICTVNKTCAVCTTGAQCAAKSNATPACASGGACVQCTDNSTCSGSTPFCDTTTNKCVACLNSAGCSGTTPICTNQVCTACTTPAQCAAKSGAAPACASGGACVQCTDNSTCSGSTPFCDTTTNKCVACLNSAGCSGVTPICTNQVCTACTTPAQCAAKSGAAPACASTGACVQCTDNSTCSGTTPICTVNNTCAGCTSAAQCVAKSSAAPACASSGACVQCTDNGTCSGTTPICDTTTTNKCVQCLTSVGCSGATPICAGNICRGCTSDSECASIGPGVCMAHQDARCASAAETIVVAANGALPSVSSLTGKRLVVVRGTASGVLTWNLTSTGLPQMSVVGQNTGTITGLGVYGSIPVQVMGGDVYLRNLTITGGTPGLLANGGGVLRLDHVSVINNPGAGISIDGSAFDIRNTTVSANGDANTSFAIFLQNLSTVTSGPKSLTLCTVTNNYMGVACAYSSDAPATATGVLVLGSTIGDISPACGFTSCGTASTTCGAQP